MQIQTKSLTEAIQLLSGNDEKTSPAQHTSPEGQKKTSTGTILVALSYKSSAGTVNNQEILIRRALCLKGEIYLDGVTMDRRVPRLIKTSLVNEVRDLISGRVWLDPYAFVEKYFNVSLSQPKQPIDASQSKTNLPENTAVTQNDFTKAIERIGTELTVLMYLVAIDGERNKAERQKVLDYALARTTDLRYDKEDMTDYIISLAPDKESFSLALAKSLSKDQKTVQELVEAILGVIMVDGRVDPKERAFLIRIMDLLEQGGYDIHLPI